MPKTPKTATQKPSAEVKADTVVGTIWQNGSSPRLRGTS